MIKELEHEELAKQLDVKNVNDLDECDISAGMWFKINEIIDVVNRLEEHKHNIIKWHIDKVSDGCMAKLVTSTPIIETSEPIEE